MNISWELLKDKINRLTCTLKYIFRDHTHTLRCIKIKPYFWNKKKIVDDKYRSLKNWMTNMYNIDKE
jgi:hypothetical protein